MNKFEVFANAKWIGNNNKYFSIVRRKFNVLNPANISLRIIGLGFFECFINGERVSDELFQPLNSEYEVRHTCIVNSECFTSFHQYYKEYDLMKYIKNGVNTLCIYFGGGWYQKKGWYSKGYGFGNPKCIYRIYGIDEKGPFDFVSSKNDLIHNGYVKKYKFDHKPYELVDLRLETINAFEEDFSDRFWHHSKELKDVNCVFLETKCEPDRVIEEIKPALIIKNNDISIYDIGKNTTGYPELIVRARKNEKIIVTFSESINYDYTLNIDFSHGQKLEIISDGKIRMVEPIFIWYGFRYFSIEGKADVKVVKIVHQNLKLTGDIKTDNSTINFIFNAYKNTQLSNIHSGTLLDCPHLEKRGYTGDGSLTQRACMYTFDAKELYRKWIRDIVDGQNKYTGRINNCAPFVYGSAGGYSGWAGAVINVPYEYYLKYGEIDILKEYFINMEKYIMFMEKHSVNGLIEKKRDECIGEWCTPQELILDYRFINTCQYIIILERMIDICRTIGKKDNIEYYKKLIELKRKAVIDNYMDADGNFFNCVQGANAFAYNAGCFSSNTYGNLIKYYEEKKELDTGIFGSELVPRILCENGNADLAFSLILSEGTHSYYELKKSGETTLLEYMPNSLCSRSKNHPMFGAVVDVFYDYLAGIKADIGMKKVTIEPSFVKQVNKLEARVMTAYGELFLSYIKVEKEISFIVDVPLNLEVILKCNGKVYDLQNGSNKITVEYS